MKRILSLVLSMLTVLSLFGTISAFADGEPTDDADAVGKGYYWRIGAETSGTYYNSFQTAVEAAAALAKAGADTTLTVIGNVTVTGSINLGAAAAQETGANKVTVAGKVTGGVKPVITLNTADKVAFVGRQASIETHYVFENLKFVSGEGVSASTFFNLEKGTKDLTFNDCDFELDKSTTQYGLFFPRLSLTMNRCTVKTNTACAVVSSDKTVAAITMTDCVVSGGTALITAPGAQTITNVTYTNALADGTVASVCTGSGAVTATGLILKNSTVGDVALSSLIAMTEGASVRCKAADDCGIRFQSVVTKANLDLLEGLINDGKIKGYAFGTLVAKAEDVTGEFTSAKVATAVATTAVNGIRTAANGDKTVSVAMTAIKTTHYETDFAARAYIDVTLTNDSVLRIYGAFDADKNVRNVREVAEAALADVQTAASGEYTTLYKGNYSRFSTAQLAVIESYIGE